MGESGELACYDVSTGLCSSALKLETAVTAVADGRNGVVWLLDVHNG